jgi:hypothetical protein
MFFEQRRTRLVDNKHCLGVVFEQTKAKMITPFETKFSTADNGCDRYISPGFRTGRGSYTLLFH